MRSTKRAVAILAWAILLFLPLALYASGSTQQKEEDLGRKYSAQIEQEIKLSEDKAAIERVERVGKAIAEIAKQREVPAIYGKSDVCPFNYQFKVVEDKDVNAYSLPGGIIYVHTGLLNIAKSDDELAGVLAHEVAHAAHHHLLQLIGKQSKLDRLIALIALAGVLTNVRSQDLNNLIYGAQLLRTGKMSGYTQEAEVDADRTAVAYLAKSSFNPDGMLAFMKKLDDLHDQQPTLPLGIYQDHPPTFKRVESIAKAMADEGYKVDLRKALDIAYAKVMPPEKDGDKCKVVIRDKVIWEPACLPNGADSKSRSEACAQALNSLLDEGLKPKDVTVDCGNRCVIAKGRPLIKIENEDLAPDAKTDRAALDQARSNLVYAIWADWLADVSIAQKGK